MFASRNDRVDGGRLQQDRPLGRGFDQQRRFPLRPTDRRTARGIVTWPFFPSFTRSMLHALYTPYRCFSPLLLILAHIPGSRNPAQAV